MTPSLADRTIRSDRRDRAGFQSEPRGALIISLDFELHWGVRERQRGDGPYLANLLGARAVVPKLLELFKQFEIAVTWATVGFLFARSKAELEAYAPKLRPKYHNQSLCSYRQVVGDGEKDDPIHFAHELISEIRRYPLQEIGSHTFGHYFCLEPGQDRLAFEDDLRSAVAIAASQGINLRSMVFPRNQCNPDYLATLQNAGFTCYRGNERGWINTPGLGGMGRRLRRGVRLVDNYCNLSGPNLTKWENVVEPSGLANLASSRFLRPFVPRARQLEELRLRRITQDMNQAAVTGQIFHLWWHPHNFGVHTSENLEFLRRVLQAFRELRDKEGMLSLGMADAAEYARRRCTFDRP